MTKGKTRGLLSARKAKNTRKRFRWSDPRFRERQKRNKNILQGAPMATGVVLEKTYVEAKQPNSAVRKAVVVQLTKNGKRIKAFVPLDGGLKFIDENDEVLLEGIGKRASSKGDIPGLKYRVCKVKGVSLDALYLGKKDKPRS